MPVTTNHPDYIKHLPEWQMMAQAMGGSLAIKGDPANLPKPSGMVQAEKKDPADRHLYENYLARAQYQHWVRDGVRAMMGLVSRQIPVVELPGRISEMEASATPDGFSLRQLFMRTVREVLIKGRVLLVVDIDATGQPFIAMYTAETVINWREAQEQGRSDLSLVVATEQRINQGADEFSHDSTTYYRVMDLDSGQLRVRVLDQGGAQVGEEIRATTGRDGRALDFLPLVFVGSTDNSPDVDEVPLLTMAKAALADYQLSADYFTALHQTSHPQPWVSGLDDEVELSVTGPSAAWDLGPSGSCGYLEFQGAGIEAVRQAMNDQKNAALEAGARVMDMGGVESGEARKVRQSDQHATLHSIVITAAEAIEQCLRYAAEWVGEASTDKVVFSVVPDFEPVSVDPQVLQQLQAAVVAGGVSWDTYWQYLATGKLPEGEYALELEKIQAEGPRLGAIEE